MAELFTARQVIDLLKIDRTTLYRMLKDGRLNGVKIGSQWRFRRSEVEAMMFGQPPEPEPETFPTTDLLPVFCITPLQEVLADIAQIGVLTTDSEGNPITDICNCCEFCRQILSSESGRQGCIASWRRLASRKESAPKFVTCHAGLKYARAPIKKDGKLLAMLIAGQFYESPPDKTEENKRIKELAKKYKLNEDELKKAAQNLSVLDERWRKQISEWMGKIAQAMEHITCERADYLKRLRKITELSNIAD